MFNPLQSFAHKAQKASFVVTGQDEHHDLQLKLSPRGDTLHSARMLRTIGQPIDDVFVLDLDGFAAGVSEHPLVPLSLLGCKESVAKEEPRRSQIVPRIAMGTEQGTHGTVLSTTAAWLTVTRAAVGNLKSAAHLPLNRRTRNVRLASHGIAHDRVVHDTDSQRCLCSPDAQACDTFYNPGYLDSARTHRRCPPRCALLL